MASFHTFPLPLTMHDIGKQVRRRARQAEVLLRHTLGLAQPEERLIHDAQTYWNDESSPIRSQNCHWRGAGVFADEDRWLTLGRESLDLFDRLAPTAGLAPGAHFGRVIDWGCGGGMNAVHFAPRSRSYIGVDIVEANLEECTRQLRDIGFTAFEPVLIDSAEPEAVLRRVPPGSCDLFHCIYVFEAFPSPEYGLRIMRIAHELLHQGGTAFVQLRFDRGSIRTVARRWGYARNLSDTANWRTDAFWASCKTLGFTPHAMFYLHYQPLVLQSNYAYFLMTKGPTASATAETSAQIDRNSV